MGADLRREGVGGVHDGVDRVLAQPGSEALDTTEPAYAHRTDRQPRMRDPAGERGHDVESALTRRDPGQFPGLTRAAEDQDSQGCPLK
ncbi:hypothetical protein NN3_25390 [Nocardia neocaledoniensis NBRC 108232]|nr:hypothetical protein NN3_25390 [Nocardia neocaledoniensis NBRC 108232]